MNKKTRKSINKLLAYFLTLLGISGACALGGCAMEYDTAYTDDLGNYSVQVQDFPQKQDFLMVFKDIDGEQNGSYLALDTIIKFTDPEFTNPEGSWYSGETSKELNISLKKED